MKKPPEKRRFRHIRMAVATSAIFYFAASGNATAEETTVASAFTPGAITLGQQATFSVSITGDKQPSGFNLPAVDGISFEYLGPSRSVQSSVVNGKFQTSVTVSYKFRADIERSGDFVLPSFRVAVGGKIHNVPAATLSVLPPDGKDAVTMDEVAFLELACPQGSLFAGQSAVCRLDLFILAALTDARYGRVEQTGDAFAQGKVDENGTQKGERRNDLNYRKISWPVTFTPLKSGSQKIAFKIVVEISFPRQRQSGGGSSVFDRFWNDDFFGMRDRRQLNVSTGDVALEISPLPTTGRPESFSGAIGKFSIQQSVSTKSLSAGDPLSLRITLSGRGNFERIQPLELVFGDAWKTYEPSAEYSPTDKLEVEGSKVFEYVLIPQSSEITETPAVKFAYFDPAVQTYQEITTAPIPIAVATAPDAGILNMPIRSAGGGNKPATQSGNTLLPIMLLSGAWVEDSRPIFLSRNFALLQCVPLVLIVGLTIYRKRSLRVRDDTSFARHIRAGKSARKWLQEARLATQTGNTEKFYSAAQRAIQESLGRHFDNQPETLIFPEIEAFLLTREISAGIIEDTSGFFTAGDAIKFAGATETEVSLSAEEKKLQNLIGKLSALKR